MDRNDPRFLKSEEALRLLDLAGSGSQPQVITQLQKEIEAETRAAVFRADNGQMTKEDEAASIMKIVKMKRRLDYLCILWSKGALQD